MYKLFKINGNSQQFPEFERFHELSKEFLPYAQEKLGFNKPVSVNLLSDPQNAKDPLGKTAYYEPEKMKITLFVDKRHVKDILRSMAHELVHHTQNCRGEFEGGLQAGEGYAQEDGKLRKMEEEAYLKGQMLLRDWEDGRDKVATLEEEVAYVYKRKPGVSEKACKALRNPINVKRRQELPDRGVATIGGSLEKSVNVKSFEHAYQIAQCHRADTFKYRGYKGKKFVNDEFSTDLYEKDPTRGISSQHFDQMHQAYDRSIRNLEESTLKENQEMSRVNEVSDEIKARTAPKDKANKADFLPKNVRDKITGEEETVDESVFAPNHYCVHHGGVQHNGAVHMAEAVSHNYNTELGRVTHYDMKLEDGTILENVAFEDIQVTNASLAEAHPGNRDDGHAPVKKMKEEELEEEETVEEVQTEGWTSKKDGLLFERLIKKWTK